MKASRWWALAGSTGLVVSMAAAVTPAAMAATSPGRVTLKTSAAPARTLSKPAGAVAKTSRVSFDLTLALRNASGAKSFIRQVSTPGSKTFHHYLTLAQFNSRYGPTSASISKAEAWLRGQGFKVTGMPKTKLYVSASGTAAQVEKAFGVKLGMYMVNGVKLREAAGALSVPASLGSSVSGVVGVNQFTDQTDLTHKGATPAGAKPAEAEPAPPAGFINPQPCSAFWGQKKDKADSPSLYAPFSSPQTYDICGYTPQQLRGGYKLNSVVNNGTDGSGVAIGIVDAYDSPTLLSDAQQYFSMNDPSHPMAAGQFVNFAPASTANFAACGASGWFDEQSLDVESEHAMAPGATIGYFGAASCFDADLLAAENTAISSGVSVVSNSWGSPLGELFESEADRTAFDDTFMVADATGVSVLFSSGDDGDNFADFGITGPDYPAISPFVTAVGGTTLEVNKNNGRKAEFGWSTGKQVLCNSSTTTCGSATTPTGSLLWNAGGGGGTSFSYLQPFYQAGVVPNALALKNQDLFGNQLLRVIPDISLDADAQSGFLIGLTQTFPDGVHFGEFKEGGTSLASPSLAGILADADQAAGQSLGFVNPVLYKDWTQTPAAFNDIVPPANPNATSTVRVDFANTVDSSAGFIVSLRQIDYQGPEVNCDSTGNCETRNVTLNAAKGFDSLTGLGSPGRRFVQSLSRF
jgi:subtilase family serine protease